MMHIKLKNILSKTLIVTVIILAAAIIYTMTANPKGNNSKADLKNAGKNNFDQLIDVGGFRLHIHCTGTGGPIVILDSGAGMPGNTWMLVQREVEKFTRVCSYDRAGYGLSDLGPIPRTSLKIAQELHILLRKAEINSPYIVVGHSLGGINMRTFAALHPREVYGIVLVDSPHEDELEIFKPQTSTLTLKEKVLNFIEEHINYFGYILYKINIQESIKPELFSELEWQYINIATYNDYITLKEEIKVIETSFLNLKQLNTNLGNKPLTFITRGDSPYTPDDMQSTNDVPVEQRNIFLGLQQQLAALSTNSTHIVAHKSNHFIQFHESGLIVEAIRNMVMQLRHGKTK